MTSQSSDSYHRIYAVVRRVPKGRVATYGQVARLAGMPKHARLVGYALHALPEGTTVPWHRVINARGTVSTRSRGFGGHDTLQQIMLVEEGVTISVNGTIPLARFQWRPRPIPQRAKRKKSGDG